METRPPEDMHVDGHPRPIVVAEPNGAAAPAPDTTFVSASGH